MTDTVRINWFYVGRGLRGEVLEHDGNVELSVDLTDLGDEFETAMRFPQHLLVGALVDRPPADEVPVGALYSADDGTVYQAVYQTVDGTVDWETWATAGGGGASPADTAGWMPLTTVVGGVPELVWESTDSLIPTYGPF
jgi:hypothetical protein